MKTEKKEHRVLTVLLDSEDFQRWTEFHSRWNYCYQVGCKETTNNQNNRLY